MQSGIEDLRLSAKLTPTKPTYNFTVPSKKLAKPALAGAAQDSAPLPAAKPGASASASQMSSHASQQVGVSGRSSGGNPMNLSIASQGLKSAAAHLASTAAPSGTLPN